MPTYSAEEAREVFARAARDQQAAPPADDGLTLDELQDIGRASGLDPEYIAAAARAVRLGAPERRRETRAGVATGVSYTATLPEPPSDGLWDALVADARRTFDARGTTDVSGHAREWRNGNLVVALEPAGDGSRLSLRTRRADAAPVARLGLAFGLIGLLIAAMSGMLDIAAWPGLVIALMSAALGGATWTRQQAWAAAREAQMQGLAERAAARVVRQGTAPGSETPVADRPAVAVAARLDGTLLDDPLHDPLDESLGGTHGGSRRARS